MCATAVLLIKQLAAEIDLDFIVPLAVLVKLRPPIDPEEGRSPRSRLHCPGASVCSSSTSSSPFSLSY